MSCAHQDEASQFYSGCGNVAGRLQGRLLECAGLTALFIARHSLRCSMRSSATSRSSAAKSGGCATALQKAGHGRLMLPSRGRLGQPSLPGATEANRFQQPQPAELRGWREAQGKFVTPIKYRSHSRAARRPSLMAQTTKLWPRRMSPAAKTPSTLVPNLP
jgi:hypothetical protein